MISTMLYCLAERNATRYSSQRCNFRESYSSSDRREGLRFLSFPLVFRKYQSQRDRDLAVLICRLRGHSGVPACTGSASGVLLICYGSFMFSDMKDVFEISALEL